MNLAPSSSALQRDVVREIGACHALHTVSQITYIVNTVPSIATT